MLLLTPPSPGIEKLNPPPRVPGGLFLMNGLDIVGLYGIDDVELNSRRLMMKGKYVEEKQQMGKEEVNYMYGRMRERMRGIWCLQVLW